MISVHSFQRVFGFVGCAAFGWLLSFMGTLTLIGGPSDKNIRTFVALYVIGNVRRIHYNFPNPT